MNLLWHQLDTLVRGVFVDKHVYGATGYRWGEKYRGADFRGHNQEIHAVDEASWGAALAIFTGPKEFSKKLVWELRLNGRRNWEGRVWQCRPCPEQFMNDGTCAKSCPRCDGTGLEPVSEIAVPEERDYFRVCGVQYAEPWERR